MSFFLFCIPAFESSIFFKIFCTKFGAASIEDRFDWVLGLPGAHSPGSCLALPFAASLKAAVSQNMTGKKRRKRLEEGG
jgi:hypothetical protein